MDAKEFGKFLSGVLGLVGKWCAGEKRKPARFDRYFGLCSNLNIYYSINNGEDVDAACWPVKKEMKEQFLKAGLDDNTPFNPAGDYFSESFDRMCHLNVRRIVWVKTHAKAE